VCGGAGVSLELLARWDRELARANEETEA
jgi:hypothetical protein